MSNLREIAFGAGVSLAGAITLVTSCSAMTLGLWGLSNGRIFEGGSAILVSIGLVVGASLLIGKLAHR